MAEDYARVLARVAAGQLAEIVGYEAVQESAVEILADLMLHYLTEVSISANSYASLASRSDVNVHDVSLALEDLGTSVEELRAYSSSLSSEENTFAHPVPTFPVRRPARAIPSFDEKGEQAPAHIPSFLPAFPDAHTFQHTPAFSGHELQPQKQTEIVQQQRRAAEKALMQLHKRTKLGGGSSSGREPAAAAPGPAAQAAKGEPNANPFLAEPQAEPAHAWQHLLRQHQQQRGAGRAASVPAGAGRAPGAGEGVVAVPEELLLRMCPHHVVFDRQLVVRQLGPALSGSLPWVKAHSTKLGEVFKVVHPETASTSAPGQHGEQQQQQQLDASFFSSNPFRTFVLGPVQQGEASSSPPELQGQVVSAHLRLKQGQGGEQAAAGEAVPGASGSGSGHADGSKAEAGGKGEEPEELLLFLAALRTATDEELQALDREAEAQSLRAAARTKQAAEGGAAGTDPTEAALRAFTAGDGEMTWKCSTHFEDNGGPLKPTFAAGFSQDWTTATRRAALALASRREQEDAYKEAHKGKT